MTKLLSFLSLAVIVGAVALPAKAQAETSITFVSGGGHGRHGHSYDRHDYRHHGYHRRHHGHDLFFPSVQFFYPPVVSTYHPVYVPVVPTYRTRAVLAPVYSSGYSGYDTPYYR